MLRPVFTDIRLGGRFVNRHNGVSVTMQGRSMLRPYETSIDLQIAR